MRKLLFLLLFTIGLCAGKEAFSQGSYAGWSSYTELKTGATFMLPVTALMADSIHTTVYAAPVDSLLGLQVHVFDSAWIQSNDIFDAALAEAGNDTLRAFASIMLLATNSELTSIQDLVSNSGKKGIEIGIHYLSLASDYDTHSFLRFYWWEGIFISFTATGVDTDLGRLVQYKDDFYNSINL